MTGVPRDSGKYFHFLFLLLLVYQRLLMIKETTRMFKTSSFKFDTNTNLNASSASQHADYQLQRMAMDTSRRLATSQLTMTGARDILETQVGHRWCIFSLFLEHHDALTTSNREEHITKTSARDMTLAGVILILFS